MDPFVVVILGGVAVIVIFVLLLGRFYPGSGADVLDWKPNHAALETQIENELDDIDQMLEAANERRRRRGEAELTEDTLHDQVREHQRESVKRRDDYMAELEIAQMLDRINERRREKGEPEQTIEQLKAELGL